MHSGILHTLLENLSDDIIAWLYVTKFSIISLYLTKLYVKYSVAIAFTVKYSEACKNFSNSVYVTTISCMSCYHHT